MNVKTNAEMTEQRVQSHARMDFGESRRNCANSEKEWLRKLTTGQPTAKEEVKAPQRVTGYLHCQNCRNSSRNNQI